MVPSLQLHESQKRQRAMCQYWNREWNPRREGNVGCDPRPSRAEWEKKEEERPPRSEGGQAAGAKPSEEHPTEEEKLLKP